MNPGAIAVKVRQNITPDQLAKRARQLSYHYRGAGLFLLGVLAGFSAAPYHLFPFLVIGLTALVWVLDDAADADRPGRTGFWRAFLFAWGYIGIGVFWVSFAFFNRGGAFVFFGPLAALAGAGFLALFWGAAGAVYSKAGLKGPERILLFALVFLVAEMAKGLPFTQFPWNLPSHVWAAGGAMSQSAAWIGSWGLSLITLLAFASPAALSGRGSAASRRMPVLAALIIMALIFAGGVRRLADSEVNYQPDVLLRLVQIDVDQIDKWSEGGGDRLRARYLETTFSPGLENVSHVIWPEGALPLYLIEDGDMLTFMSERLGEGQMLIAGTPRRERGSDGRVRQYNSLAAFEFARDRPHDVWLYDKVRLVPFGEFMPGGEWVRGLGQASLSRMAEGYTPGAGHIVMDLHGLPPFTPLICYEIVFEGLVSTRPEAPQTPESAWILNVSNDAWFGPTAGPRQHFNIARYRSIETGQPLVRAATRGITGVVDPWGRALATAAPRDTRALDVRLPMPLEGTFYTRTGGLAFWIILLLVLSGLLFYVVLERVWHKRNH